MASSTELTEPAVVRQLQSEDHEKLVNAIDKLRSRNINADISIPEIVVCGDQSSGKSSVLEAIAGVPFPMGPGTMTRFPTEVVLRKASKERIEVRINATDKGWNQEQRAQIAAWQPDFPVSSTGDVPKVVMQAHTFLESLDRSRSFWHDRLHIELSGESQPHLTLIDLPGLIQNDAQEINTDSILHLTLQYIRSERAVVLAVVDAPTELARHQILRKLKEVECEHRTMGILTMPDKLESGSIQEKNLVQAVSEGREFGLGWHVLKNQPCDRLDQEASRSSELLSELAERTTARRDEEEKQFFTGRSAWIRTPDNRKGVPDDCKGAPNLRTKVSRQLLARIQQDLPKLIKEMKVELQNKERTLQQLGKPRDTDEEKRKYLTELSGKMMPLVQSGLQGNYFQSNERFFSDKEERQLRDEINRHIDLFASTMRESGRLYKYQIGDSCENEEYLPLPDDGEILFNIDHSARVQKYAVTVRSYLEALASYIKRTRNLNLRGTVPQAVYTVIFRQQSKPWKSIVEQCTNSCKQSTRQFLADACMHLAGPYGGPKLMDHLVMPALKHRVQTLTDKITELLWPYLESHPMISDSRFSAPSTAKGEIEAVVGRLTPDEYAAATAMEYADTYYDVAMRTLVENVATLAVEKCLLHGLDDIVSAVTMQSLDSDTVALIADERPEDRVLRSSSMEQRDTLVEVLEDCAMYGGRQSAVDNKDTKLQKSSAQTNGAPIPGIFSKPLRTSAPPNKPAAAPHFSFSNSPVPTTWFPRSSSQPAAVSSSSTSEFTNKKPKFFTTTGKGLFDSVNENTVAQKASATALPPSPFSLLSAGKPSPGAESPETSSVSKTSIFGSATKGTEDSSNQPALPFSGLKKDSGALTVPYLVAQEYGMRSMASYCSLSTHPFFQDLSHEEIRLADYAAGRTQAAVSEAEAEVASEA